MATTTDRSKEMFESLKTKSTKNIKTAMENGIASGSKNETTLKFIECMKVELAFREMLNQD